jgi:hypothetical protein
MDDYNEIIKILQSIKGNGRLLEFIRKFLQDLTKNFY